MLHCAGPGIDLPESVIECRYEVLRKPLGFSIDAARLSDDGDAIHAWVVLDGQVVSVGRAHLISGDGGSQDLPGSGPMLPPFPPLASDEAERFRPAIQIRQMGTRPVARRTGLGTLVLDALLRASVRTWGARTGFLQARIEALRFYQANGWTLIGNPFDVPGVGPHRMMSKGLEGSAHDSSRS